MAPSTVAPSDAPPAPRTCLASFCCVETKPRDAIASWMILDDNASAAPSCMQMLLCQCQPEARVLSGVEDVPQIKGIAGATLQRAPPDWPSKGSVQTLKWCKFDKEKRVAQLQVFGGFGGLSSVGLWTEPVTLKWHCLINLARCCNYSYRFSFSEDYRYARINILVNCCCCCPLVPPCAPAWCTVPDFIAKFNAVQHESSTDGTYWVRNSSSCGKPWKYSYDLVTVVMPDGTPGPYHADLAATAPETMLISR